MRSRIVVALAVNNFTRGAGFTPPNKMSKMNVVDTHIASNARRTSTIPWGDLLEQRRAELNVIINHCNTYVFVFSVVSAADTVVNAGWRAATCRQRSQHLTSACVSLVAHTVKYEPFCKARDVEVT